MAPHSLAHIGGAVGARRGSVVLGGVLNAVNLRAKITSDAVVALSQHGTVAPVFIQQSPATA